MSDQRQFTLTEKRKDCSIITTGLNMRQLLNQIKRDLTEGIPLVVEVRTEANDPMQFGP